MIKGFEMLLNTENKIDKLNNSLNTIDKIDKDESNNKFEILFENMLNEVQSNNKIDKVENNSNIEKKIDDYKIEIVINNESFLEKNFNLKDDKHKDVVAKVNKRVDNSNRMSQFLTKMGTYFKDNLENIKLNNNLSSKFEKKIEINFSQLQNNIKDKIKIAIADFENKKINESDFRTSLKNILNSFVIKDLNVNLNVKDKIKDIRVVKRVTSDNNNIESKKEIKEDIIFERIKTNTDIKNNISTQDNFVKEKKTENIENKSKSKLEQYLARFKEDLKVTDSKSENVSNVNVSEKNFNIENKRAVDTFSPKNSVENKEELFRDMVKNTKILLTNNETKFSTMIRPETLGRMDFHINIKDGQLNGKIIVHTKEAFDFFRSNVEELRAVFQKGNVEFGKIDIALAGQMDNVFQTLDFMNGNFNNNKRETLYNEIGNGYVNYDNYNIKEENETGNNRGNIYSDSKINLFI